LNKASYAVVCLLCSICPCLHLSLSHTHARTHTHTHSHTHTHIHTHTNTQGAATPRSHTLSQRPLCVHPLVPFPHSVCSEVEVDDNWRSVALESSLTIRAALPRLCPVAFCHVACSISCALCPVSCLLFALSSLRCLSLSSASPCLRALCVRACKRKSESVHGGACVNKYNLCLLHVQENTERCVREYRANGGRPRMCVSVCVHTCTCTRARNHTHTHTHTQIFVVSACMCWCVRARVCANPNSRTHTNKFMLFACVGEWMGECVCACVCLSVCLYLCLCLCVCLCVMSFYVSLCLCMSVCFVGLRVCVCLYVYLCLSVRACVRV